MERQEKEREKVSENEYYKGENGGEFNANVNVVLPNDWIFKQNELRRLKCSNWALLMLLPWWVTLCEPHGISVSIGVCCAVRHAHHLRLGTAHITQIAPHAFERSLLWHFQQPADTLFRWHSIPSIHSLVDGVMCPFYYNLQGPCTYAAPSMGWAEFQLHMCGGEMGICWNMMST